MGSLIAPIIGANEADNKRRDANDAQRRALELFSNIRVPTLDEQQLQYNLLNNTGDLQNSTESNIGMGPSAMEGVQTDPRLAQAQMQALTQLSQTGQMGMTPAEKSALMDAQRSANQMAQAKSAQIMDNAARRGMGGSGAELAAQLQNAQSAADRASQNTNDISASAWNNALNAISQSGNLAGQINQQQFGQKSDIAKAKDYINQFNTQNAQGVQQRNVANQNAANLRNLTNKQNIANSNVGLQNQQQEHNKGLIQQNFNNQMSRAGGQAGQYQGIANSANQAAGRTADMYAGIGKGIDTGVGAYLNSRSNSGSSPDGFSRDEEDAFLAGGV